MDEATYKKNYIPFIIRGLFTDKSPAVDRLISGFVYRFVSRIWRIDLMNDPTLYHHGYKKEVEFAGASLKAFNESLNLPGRENLPEVGRYMCVAGHPMGGCQNIKDHGYCLPDDPPRNSATFKPKGQQP